VELVEEVHNLDLQAVQVVVHQNQYVLMLQEMLEDTHLLKEHLEDKVILPQQLAEAEAEEPLEHKDKIQVLMVEVVAQVQLQLFQVLQ
jgi:hypothetical protein